MAVVTATQVTEYTDISASAATIAASGLIPVVQSRIVDICFTVFASEDIYQQGAMTFGATAGTILAPDSWVSKGFAVGDEIYVYGSRRNDGFYTVASLSDETLTITTGESVVDELSGASILVSLVQWPDSLPYIAAQMVKYDYDDRKSRTPGITSQSLGPRSESYGDDLGSYGYPTELIDALPRVARLM